MQSNIPLLNQPGEECIPTLEAIPKTQVLRQQMSKNENIIAYYDLSVVPHTSVTQRGPLLEAPYATCYTLPLRIINLCPSLN